VLRGVPIMVRRAAPVLAVLAALLSGGSAALAQTPALSAKTSTCTTGPDPLDRVAVFSGSMPRDDAAAMAMRFDLYEKLPGGRFKPIALAHWGVWERTDRTDVPGFVFTKRVEQLAAPAAFRAVVTFHWFDAKGAVVRTARRTTATCRQPDWRPNLHIERVIFPAGHGPTRVVVRNRGRGDAGPFRVDLSTPDVFRAAAIDALAAGARTTVALQIPRCRPGQRVLVKVDAGRRVAEADEHDNTVRLVCPAAR
jgi:hypothetical protein